jgi:hypothetical protein
MHSSNDPDPQIGLGQLLFRNSIPNRQVVKKTAESVIVVLQDTPANILKRITFYDSESRQIQKELTDRERGLCLREIKDDIAYFRRTYHRAHITVDIAGLGPDEASLRIKGLLMQRICRSFRA